MPPTYTPPTRREYLSGPEYLTPGEKGCLGVIRKMAQPFTLAEVAAELKGSQTAAAVLIRGLNERGLVWRVPGTNQLTTDANLARVAVGQSTDR